METALDSQKTHFDAELLATAIWYRGSTGPILISIALGLAYSFRPLYGRALIAALCLTVVLR